MSDDKTTTDTPFRLPTPDFADKRAVMSYADDLSAEIIKATAKAERLKAQWNEVREEIAAADTQFADMKKSKRIDKATLSYVTAKHTESGSAKRARATRAD